MCGLICFALLIAGVVAGASAALSSKDQSAVVSAHNTFRRNVKPTASDMREMTWHEEAGKLAQEWANSCSNEHNEPVDKKFGQCGQNIFTSFGTSTPWSEVVKVWHDEVKEFTYGAENNFMSVGHYTQVVWAESYKVGCGYANCGDFHFYVCNYCPPGNDGERLDRPYKKGAKCASCPKTCKNGLCV